MTDEETALYGRRLSAQDAQRELGIPAGTVRSWYHRRSFTGLWDIGRDNRNHPLFYEADLLALKLRRRVRDKHGRRHHTMQNLLDSNHRTMNHATASERFATHPRRTQ